MTTALQPLLTANSRYSDETYSGFNLNYNGTTIMGVDLYKSDREFPYGYFAAHWLTALSNFDGKREVAQSYARLHRQFQYPNGTDSNEIQILFGGGAEAHLIFGASNPLNLQTGKSSSFGGNLEFGIKPGNLDEAIREIIKSERLPEVFTFMRLNSPYCGHYIGTRAPLGEGDEAGVISAVNITEEVINFFKATTYYDVHEEHMAALNRKLNEMLWKLPRLEPR